MISVYSFASSVILFNIALILVYLLRRRKMFLVRYGTQTLLLLTILGIIRLFSPIDHELAYIVRSYTVIPALQSALNVAPIEKTPSFTFGNILLTIWALGIIIFAVKHAILICLDYRKRLRYHAKTNEQVELVKRQLECRYPVLVSCQVTTPHVAGFIRPKIYVPPLELSKEEWTYVLKHELQHIKAHDNIIKLFYFAIQTVFWWNPVTHLFLRELDILLEMRCDSVLASNMDAEERIEYLGTMLSVINQLNGANDDATPVNAYFAESSSSLEQRFEFVLDFDANKLKAVRNAICCIMVVVFLLSYFVIVQPAYDPPMEDIPDVHNVTEETAFLIFDGEKYFLYINNEFFTEIAEDQLNSEPFIDMEIIEGSR